MQTMLVITAAATDEMNQVRNTDIITGWGQEDIYTVQQLELFNTKNACIFQVICMECMVQLTTKYFLLAV